MGKSGVLHMYAMHSYIEIFFFCFYNLTNSLNTVKQNVSL